MNDEMVKRIAHVLITEFSEARRHSYVDDPWELPVAKAVLQSLTPADLESLLPEGMVIAPVEATNEMKPHKDEPICPCCGYDNGYADPGDLYADMIAARPKLGEV